jgi:hypothetical protein
MPSTDDRLNKNPPETWSLYNALSFIDHINESIYSCGYVVAIAGGVINKGYSVSDLDIIVIKRLRVEQHEGRLESMLDHLGVVIEYKYTLPQKRWIARIGVKKIDITFAEWV